VVSAGQGSSAQIDASRRGSWPGGYSWRCSRRRRSNAARGLPACALICLLLLPCVRVACAGGSSILLAERRWLLQRNSLSKLEHTMQTQLLCHSVHSSLPYNISGCGAASRSERDAALHRGIALARRGRTSAAISLSMVPSCIASSSPEPRDALRCLRRCDSGRCAPCGAPFAAALAWAAPDSACSPSLLPSLSFALLEEHSLACRLRITRGGGSAGGGAARAGVRTG